LKPRTRPFRAHARSDDGKRPRRSSRGSQGRPRMSDPLHARREVEGWQSMAEAMDAAVYSPSPAEPKRLLTPEEKLALAEREAHDDDA
jgi:hypothetical protein